jgi:serine/threonine-protein kinase
MRVKKKEKKVGKTFVWKLIRPFVAAIFFGFGLLLSGYLGLFVLHAYFATSEIEVPDFSNQDLLSVLNTANKLGIYVEVMRTESNPQLPPQVVIHQIPPPGSKLKKGNRVKVVINQVSITSIQEGGPGETAETVVVPDLRNFPVEEAEELIRSEGLKVGKISEVFHESVPRGCVISQSPPAGSKVNRNATINLLISKGGEEEVALIEVPDLVGLRIQEARNVIQQRGLRLGEIEEVEVPEKAPEVVIAQKPSPGEKLAPGGVINLTVNKKIEGLKEVKLRFPLPEAKQPIEVKVVINDQLGERVAYRRIHQGGETVEISIPSKGAGRVVIYLNDYYYWEKELR